MKISSNFGATLLIFDKKHATLSIKTPQPTL